MANTFVSNGNNGSFFDGGTVNTVSPADVPSEEAVVANPEESKQGTVINEDVKQEAENELLIKFEKPFQFEGKTYTQIDLSGIKELSGRDLVRAEKIFKTLDREDEATTMIKEKSTTYQMIVAHLATGLPMEFFNSLPIAEANKVGNAVFVFFITNQ